MNRTIFGCLLVVFLFTFTLTVPAGANTIAGFDGLPTTQPFQSVSNAWGDVPGSYAGLNWTGWEVMNRDTYNTIYGLSEAALPSNPNFAYSGHDTDTLTMSSGTSFDFLGANVSAWSGSLASPGSATSLTITGYLNNAIVSSISASLSSEWTTIGGISGPVDRLEFSNAGELGGYFRMDNLNYATVESGQGSAVPEPMSFVLIGTGLLGLGLLRRRNKTAAISKQ